MTEWKVREGLELNRFEKDQETARAVLLSNVPRAVTKAGTPFSIQNMNNIERGIFDAHNLIAAEEHNRTAAIQEIRDDYNDVQSQFEAYVFLVRYLIQLIESINGPIPGTRSLITDSGDYLITDNGDFLIT